MKSGLTLLVCAIALLTTEANSAPSKQNIIVPDKIQAIVTELPSGFIEIDLIKKPINSNANTKKKIDYKSLANTIRADCSQPQIDRAIPYPTSVVDLDAFFIIQGKAHWLPPKPTNPNDTIIGIDADGDCVRDDIEHYIARKYSKKEDYKLRKYLYEYAAWLGHFLIENIDENTAKTASNNMALAGECVDRIIGNQRSRTAINDLFGQFHNT